MQRHLLNILYLTSLLLVSSCKEIYYPPVEAKGANLLVVEGTIFDNSRTTSFRLSRTVEVVTSSFKPELNAILAVEDENHNRYPLHEQGNGIYSSLLSGLVVNKNYRLSIKTTDGKEYVSDFVQLKKTPVIDNIGWRKNSTGLDILLNTHDASNDTWYYRWDYEQTWEFRSAYYSQFIYKNSKIIDRDQTIPITTCWKNERSATALITSTKRLSQDIVSDFRLLNIPSGSWKLSILYSIFVKQYAMTEKEYFYWQKIKKNSEDLGSIFDPQPSDIPGNIHCLTTPEEDVIGYVGACTAEEKRIFISKDDVLPWTYLERCELTSVKDDPDSLRAAFSGGSFQPVSKFIASDGKDRYWGTPATCVDCTLRGFNVKPSFWP